MLAGLGSLVLIDMVAFNHSRLVIHWISGRIDVFSKFDVCTEKTLNHAGPMLV